jgi:hypothetical protein
MNRRISVAIVISGLACAPKPPLRQPRPCPSSTATAGPVVPSSSAPEPPEEDDPFPPRRCAPDAYSFDGSDPEKGMTQPLMSKDGSVVAYCSDVDVNLERPRLLTVLETSSGDVLYQRSIASVSRLEAAGRYLARWSWIPMPRIPGEADAEAKAKVPESAKPFFHMEAIGKARSKSVEITYREPLLRVEGTGGETLKEQRIQTWTYENHIGPDGTPNTNWEDVHCRGFILTYLSAAFGSVDLGFFVVVLRKQGGTPQCGIGQSADHHLVRLKP